jgi:hypothetical protein
MTVECRTLAIKNVSIFILMTNLQVLGCRQPKFVEERKPIKLTSDLTLIPLNSAYFSSPPPQKKKIVGTGSS